MSSGLIAVNSVRDRSRACCRSQPESRRETHDEAGVGRISEMISGRSRRRASSDSSTRSNSVQAQVGQVHFWNAPCSAASAADAHCSRASMLAALFALPDEGHDVSLCFGWHAETLRPPWRLSSHQRPAGRDCGGVTEPARRGSVPLRPMSTPPVTPDPRISVPAGRRDPAALPRVLRRARAHGRAERQPRAGRRPDAALHELRDGPVQGRPDRRRDSATTRGRSTTSAACASPASTTTSRRSAGRRATTRCSRCSATGASATTSSARRSTGRGTS